MKTIFDKTTRDELITRINRLGDYSTVQLAVIVKTVCNKSKLQPADMKIDN